MPIHLKMSGNPGDNKSSLLASLTGGDVDSGTETAAEQDLFGDMPEPEEDLFGSIPLDKNHDDPLQSHMAQLNVGEPSSNSSNGVSHATTVHNDTTAAAPPADKKAPSLLASSGLLGDAPENGGGGLFDAVDEEQARLDQEDRRRRVQHERLEQERVRLEQEEAARQEEQAQLARQMQQQQVPAAAAAPHPAFSPGGFYRNHPSAVAPPQQGAPSYNGNLQYTTMGGPVQTHTLRPSTTAGMHNAGGAGVMRPPARTITAPPSHATALQQYFRLGTNVGVGRRLSPQLHSPLDLCSSNTNGRRHVVSATTISSRGGTGRTTSTRVSWIHSASKVSCRISIVATAVHCMHTLTRSCRLFRRPDKHATRAIEEASASQTAEFALQRAQELQVYLNALAQHPIAGRSNVLRLFLALQDDMGTAWPEVSSNAITRLGAVGAGAAVQLAETVVAAEKIPEDNAELLTLTSSEELRMGAVTQAVPKLEGAVTLLKEHGEWSGAVGMELSKLTKEVEASDAELSQPLQVLSAGLLRSGRREKRLALELSAAMSTFVSQYKLCKNEKLAFQDRRQALVRCQKERAKADQRAQKLLLNPSPDGLDRAERDAVMSDEMAVGAVQEAQEIGLVLKGEVNRVAYQRRTEWSKSMKVVASAMKEASAERVAIWESTRENFLQAFPEYAASSSESVASGRTA